MKDKEAQELGLFDASDVTWEIVDSKRRDEVTIKLKTEGVFNVIKTYLALKMLCEKIETELLILEEAEGDH